MHDKYHDQHGEDQGDCRQAGKRPDNKKYRTPHLRADNHDQRKRASQPDRIRELGGQRRKRSQFSESMSQHGDTHNHT